LATAGRFTEARAQQYFAEMLVIMEFLHSNGVVFRDTKPENFLIDDAGHLVLIDFGLAKDMGSRPRTSTFCGTLAYIAPEMLTKRKYGKTLDYYMMGVLLYQMLTGKIPFVSQDR
jgi:serine/threonine protein kinase